MSEINQSDFLGRGLQFPLEVDEVSGCFRMSEGAENIKQSIEIILMTTKGERIMRPDFGCNLKKYVYESMDYGILVQLEQEVKKALQKWEPRITHVLVEAVSGKKQENMLEIHIQYRVRVTNNPYNMVFPFYLQEGFQQ